MSAGVLTCEGLQWGLSMLLSRLARLVSRDGQECYVSYTGHGAMMYNTTDR